VWVEAAKPVWPVQLRYLCLVVSVYVTILASRRFGVSAEPGLPRTPIRGLNPAGKWHQVDPAAAGWRARLPPYGQIEFIAHTIQGDVP